MLWMGQEMNQAYPWLGTERHGGLTTRHNQEETPMEQETGSSGARPDRRLPQWPVDEVVRRGAQALLQRALDVAVELCLERYPYVLDDHGHRQIVRHGSRPIRTSVTGAGPVPVATPRVDARALEA